MPLFLSLSELRHLDMNVLVRPLKSGLTDTVEAVLVALGGRLRCARQSSTKPFSQLR
jgi:hypothetical protein